MQLVSSFPSLFLFLSLFITPFLSLDEDREREIVCSFLNVLRCLERRIVQQWIVPSLTLTFLRLESFYFFLLPSFSLYLSRFLSFTLFLSIYFISFYFYYFIPTYIILTMKVNVCAGCGNHTTSHQHLSSNTHHNNFDCTELTTYNIRIQKIGLSTSPSLLLLSFSLFLSLFLSHFFIFLRIA